jgi:hypothetical protein
MKANENKIYDTPYRKIRKFVRIAEKFGYSVEMENKHKESYYVAISPIGGDKYAFILRFSKHALGKYNQVPAGVIDSFCSYKNCIRNLQRARSLYNRLTPTEISELWRNRNMDDEYCFIHI